jgi:hypothetical protein
MQASKRIAQATIAFMVVASATLALLPTAAAQNPVPVIALTLTPGERVAEITASAPDAVQFSGNATIDKLSFERGSVTLLAVMTTGWVATVSPASITVTNQRSILYTVTVVVPAGTLATEIGQLTVTGRIAAGGLQSQAQAQAIVTPAAYFRTIASSTTPFMESGYSTQVVAVFKIYNEGNVRDQVKVSIKNLDDLSTAQWVVQMSRTSFTIEPTLFQDIQVTIALPKAWQFASDNKVTVIDLQVSSGGAVEAGGSFVDSLPIFIRTVGFSVPGFDATFAVLGVCAAALGAGMAGGRRKRIIK